MKPLIEQIVKKDNLYKTVVSTFEKDYTLNDFVELSNKFEALLGKSLNLLGKRVALLIPDTYAYISMVFTINKLGGTVVPLSTQYRKGDLSAILSAASPHMIFTVKSYNGTNFSEYINNWIEEERIDCTLYESNDGFDWENIHFKGTVPLIDGSERNFILFTSGSTGTPKGVVIGQEAMVSTMHVFGDMLNCQPSDRLLHVPPKTILYGFCGILCALYKGFRMAIPDSFDFPKIVNMMKRVSVKKISNTPSLLRAMYNLTKHVEPEIYQDIEACYLAGELVSEGEVEEFKLMKNTKFFGVFGISEAGGVMKCDLRAKKLEWDIVEEVQFQEFEGELLIKAATLFTEYYNQPQLTKEAYTEDGWFLTGDVVEITPQNKILLKGRKKHMIKKGGQQVIPGEIEKTLLTHSEVNQAAIIGASHPVFGEQIVAFVVKEEHLNVNELFQYCAEKIARYKVPDHIEIVNEIPMTGGKTDKTSLKMQFEEIQKSIKG